MQKKKKNTDVLSDVGDPLPGILLFEFNNDFDAFPPPGPQIRNNDALSAEMMGKLRDTNFLQANAITCARVHYPLSGKVEELLPSNGTPLPETPSFKKRVDDAESSDALWVALGIAIGAALLLSVLILLLCLCCCKKKKPAPPPPPPPPPPTPPPRPPTPPQVVHIDEPPPPPPPMEEVPVLPRFSTAFPERPAQDGLPTTRRQV